MGSPPTEELNSQLLLEGNGILPNSSSCYVYAEKFKLLPHSLGRTTLSLSKTHVVLPEVDTIITFSEETVLQWWQSQPTSSVDLQRLDEISARVATRDRIRGADIPCIVNALRDADKSQHTMSWSWVIGIMIVSMIIGSLWPIWLKLFKLCYLKLRMYVHSPTEPPKVATTDNPNDDGTELQVKRESTPEKMLGTSTEFVPEALSTTLTAFVRHGVETGDCP